MLTTLLETELYNLKHYKWNNEHSGFFFIHTNLPSPGKRPHLSALGVGEGEGEVNCTHYYMASSMSRQNDSNPWLGLCDWLPKQARCYCPALSGSRAVCRKKKLPEIHIDPDIGRFFSKKTWPISSHLDPTSIVNNPQTYV